MQFRQGLRNTPGVRLADQCRDAKTGQRGHAQRTLQNLAVKGMDIIDSGNRTNQAAAGWRDHRLLRMARGTRLNWPGRHGRMLGAS
ncbi:hypothetical protein JCM19379_08690 [Methyloparacoccus murrellii]